MNDDESPAMEREERRHEKRLTQLGYKHKGGPMKLMRVRKGSRKKKRRR